MDKLAQLKTRLNRLSRSVLQAEASSAVERVEELRNHVSSFPLLIEDKPLGKAHSTVQSMLKKIGAPQAAVTLQGSRWYGKYFESLGLAPPGDVNDIDLSVFGLSSDQIKSIRSFGRPEVKHEGKTFEVHPAFLISSERVHGISRGRDAADHLFIMHTGKILAGRETHAELSKKIRQKVGSFAKKELVSFILRLEHHLIASRKGRIVLDHRRYFYNP